MVTNYARRYRHLTEAFKTGENAMRIHTISVLFLIMAIYFIAAVAAEVFIDDNVRPKSLFTYLLITVLLTGTAALAIDIDVPG